MAPREGIERQCDTAIVNALLGCNCISMQIDQKIEIIHWLTGGCLTNHNRLPKISEFRASMSIVRVELMFTVLKTDIIKFDVIHPTLADGAACSKNFLSS